VNGSSLFNKTKCTLLRDLYNLGIFEKEHVCDCDDFTKDYYRTKYGIGKKYKINMIKYLSIYQYIMIDLKIF
jgi:hypothetical protein